MHFGELEREKFRALMREYESVCGVRVMTYSILSNHFHLLIEVPNRPARLPTDDELEKRLSVLTGSAAATAKEFMIRLKQLRSESKHEEAESLREMVFRNMWDISMFMKFLKQRFTQWFNRQYDRKGTLWEERFKSVLVETSGRVLSIVAAYIDLNPVRAGMVKNPEDFRWCGYGEAMAGGRLARNGLERIVTGAERRPEGNVPEEDVLPMYRMLLYDQGMEHGHTEAKGASQRAGISREAALEVLANKGKVPIHEYLRLRVRYFVDGVALGNREFVERVFQENRKRFSERRRDGARRLRGVSGEQLFCLRNLRVRVLG
jgi:REP element-mobilizing transposase RayT